MSTTKIKNAFLFKKGIFNCLKIFQTFLCNGKLNYFSATKVALAFVAGTAALDLSSDIVLAALEQAFLDLQQALVVVFPLTAVALASCTAALLEQVFPAALLEQALPAAALDLQQALVVVAVLTVAAVAVLDFVQVLVVVFAAAALAAACGQPWAEAVPTAAIAKRTKSKNKFFIVYCIKCL